MIKWLLLYGLLSTLLAALLAQKRLRLFLLNWLIMMCLPVIGWFIPSIWPKRWLKHDAQFFSQYIEDQSEDIAIDIREGQQRLNAVQELNVVSVEEALLVNDVHVRRKVLIDIIKQDALQYIDVLKQAVTNEDTETSHYAVTAVIEMKRELTILLQKLAVEYAQQPNDTTVATTYADVIQAYMRSGFLDAQSLKQYQLTYNAIVTSLIEQGTATEQHYKQKIDTAIALHNIAEAQQTITQFKQAFPLSEQPYVAAMSIYFQLRAFTPLLAELNALKSSSIQLSSDTMQLVRYWNEVAKQYEVNK